MKKIITLLMLVCTGTVGSASAYGQVTTLDKLTGTTWKFQPPAGEKPDYESTFKYNATNRTHTLYAQQRDFSYYQPFYLSDTADTSFDEAKVGKSKNGKYLIVKEAAGDLVGTHSVYEIVKVNGKELLLRSVRYNTVLVHWAI